MKAVTAGWSGAAITDTPAALKASQR
jgi:hypothetical protein